MSHYSEKYLFRAKGTYIRDTCFSSRSGANYISIMALRQRNQQTTGEKVVEAMRTAERKAEKALTVLWDELPSWQQDNHYVLSGYRPETFSFRKCFASLSYLHNETVNIYSHLFGAISFILIGLYVHRIIPPRYPTSTRADILAFAIFFVSAVICFGMSATYHAISNHSHEVAKLGNKLDYLGIVVLIVGSFIPSVHYGFWCHGDLIWTYLSMILILGLGCTTVSTIPTFRTPAWRPFRALMFVAMGGSGIVPVLHGIKLYGITSLNKRMGLNWTLLQGLLYVSGAAIYALRIPEKWSPGRFDLYGSSHQIFHFLVVAAAVSHLAGLVKAFDYLHSQPEAQLCR